MSRLNSFFNWGTELKTSNPTLYNQLTEVYASIARAVNTKPSKNVSTEKPTAASKINSLFEIGDMWINTATNGVWVMTSRTSDIAVTWTAV